MQLRALFKFKCHDFLVTERYAGAPVALGAPAPVFPEFRRALDFLAGKPAEEAPSAEELQNALPGLDSAEAAKISLFLRNPGVNTTLEATIPENSTKEQRTAFYALVRRNGNPRLEARTVTPTKIKFQASPQLKLPPPPGRPRFWTLSLLKQDVDTMRAVQRLCAGVHPQRLQPRQVTYCGVKDQRGVTVQKIQIPGHVYPESVAAAAERAFAPAEKEKREDAQNETCEKEKIPPETESASGN